MQKGFVPILILVGILVVLGVVGGAYYLGTKRSETPSIAPQSTSKPSPDSLPTNTDETINWKTYIHAKVKYSIKVPPAWYVKVNEDDSLLATQDYLTSMTLSPDKSEGIPNREINIAYPISINGPHYDIGRQFEQGLDKLSQVKEEPPIWYKDQRSYFTQVDNHRALVKITVFNNDPPADFRGGWCGCTHKHVYIEIGNGKVIDIDGFWVNSDITTEPVFDQILSTFKFL